MSPATEKQNRSRQLGDREFIFFMALVSAMSALAIDILLPAFADMRPDFGLAADATNLSITLTVFFFGSGIGQLFYGPLADRFGRKPILAASLLLYASAALVCALAPNLTVLYTGRFIWGFAAAGPRTLTQAIVRDRYSGDAMARVMTLIQAAFSLAPIVAPVIGAGLVAAAGWRAVMLFGVVVAGVALIWSSRLPESLADENRRSLAPSAIVRSFGLVASNRITVAYIGAITMGFSAFFTFLASLELVFGEVYDKASWFVPYFSLISVSFGAVAVLSNRMLKRITAARWALMAGVGFAASAAVMFVLTIATGGMPPFLLWLAVFTIVNSCFVAFFPTANSLALEPMGSLAGTAASAIGFMSFVVGAVLASFVDRAISDNVMPMAIGYFGFASASLLFQLWARDLRN